jgi:hypothetical protein
MNVWLYGFGRLSLLVKRCENHMAISLGYIQVIWASPAAWSWSCGLHRNGHCWAAGWCHLWVYNEGFLDHSMQLLNHLTVCLHWLCHYMIWSPGTGGPWCPSILIKMESSPRMTSLSCAVMSSVPTDQLVNCTLLQNCLLVCLLSPMCLYASTLPQQRCKPVLVTHIS